MKQLLVRFVGPAIAGILVGTAIAAVIVLLTSCASSTDQRRNLGQSICEVVYGHGLHVAVRELEGNQVLIYCGN